MTFTEGLLAMVAADMKRRGRSQRAMAALLGVDHSTLSRWLGGSRALDGDSVDRIVGFFGAEYIIESLREGLRRDPERRGTCWFCKGEFVIDALIAGYDTFEEQRLACLACNERMDGNWRLPVAVASTNWLSVRNVT